MGHGSFILQQAAHAYSHGPVRKHNHAESLEVLAILSRLNGHKSSPDSRGGEIGSTIMGGAAKIH